MADTNMKRMVGKALSIDKDNRRLTAVISTKAVDRDGDVVAPRGIRIDDYMKNPVVLWAHDRSKPPIAKAVNITMNDDMATAEVEFAETDFAKEIFDLFAGGFLNAWSIGFRTSEKNDLAPRLNGDGCVTGYDINGCELTEFSAVPVPANPEALVKSLEGRDESIVKEIGKVYEKLEDSWKDDALVEFFGKLTGEVIPVTPPPDADNPYKAVRIVLAKDTQRVDIKASEDGEWEESDLTVRPGALKKSLEERGKAGKIQTTLEHGEKNEVAIDVEIVQQHENEIVEAKALQSVVTLSLEAEAGNPASDDTSGQPGEAEGKSDSDATSKEAGAAERRKLLDSLSSDLLVLRAKEASLL